jgi:FAD/FMN-containing dehydrogenase
MALGPVTRTWPAAIEIFGPATASALGLERQWTLAVRCRGNEAFTQAARQRLSDMGGEGLSFPDSVEGLRVWEALTALEAQAAIAIRMAALPTRLPRLIEVAGAGDEGNAKSDNAASAWMLAAHAGTGTLRVWRATPPPAAELDSLARRFTEIRGELAYDGGTVTLPVLPKTLLSRLDPFDLSGAPLELARGLKSTFDPAGILSPGRFFS